MPERQMGSRDITVLKCAWSCFNQYENLLPFCLLSIRLKYILAFFTTSICFISYILLKAEFFHVNLRFKRKKLWGNVVFTTAAIICIYFASLDHEFICKFPSIHWISLETKLLPLISQMLAFLVTLFILTMENFLSFALDFSFQCFNVGKLCLKCCYN